MAPYVTDDEDRGPRRQILATLFFLVLAATARILPPDQQQRIASVFRASVLRPFVMVQEGLADSRVRLETTEDLQARLDSIESLLTNQRTLAEENARLRETLGLGERLAVRYVAASVIRPGTALSESMFLLDVGWKRGLDEDATVLTGRGLVGVVKSTRAESAIGMDWTHPEFRASAMTSDGSVYGLVQAERAEFRESDRLRIDGVPFHQELIDGRVIVTSGLGGVYPRGIPIGVVEGEAETETGTGWRRSYWLRPFVEPGVTTHVLVLVGSPSGDLDLSRVWFGDEEEPRR
jgi:rod shape-determining protein MreC